MKLLPLTKRSIAAIKSLGRVEKAQYSSWVLVTSMTCADVEKYLFKFVQGRDSLMVVEITSYAAHNVSASVTNLMNDTWHPTPKLNSLRSRPSLEPHLFIKRDSLFRKTL